MLREWSQLVPRGTWMTSFLRSSFRRMSFTQGSGSHPYIYAYVCMALLVSDAWGKKKQQKKQNRSLPARAF